VSRVSTLATRALTKTSIAQLAGASEYRARNAMTALDLGFADGKVMDGFTRVFPVSVSPLYGVKMISMDIPVGAYRVVLMTQICGDSRFDAPLYHRIRINKTPFLVTSSNPD